MQLEIAFEISTDEFEKTLGLCQEMGAKILVANKNGSPNGHHDFRIKMPCDSFEDFNRVSQILLYYLDDPIVPSTSENDNESP